jgi:transcriptional regulator
MPPEALQAHLDRLSAQFEMRLLPKPPWWSGRMDQQRLAAMRAAIVGILIDVEAIEGQWKLNQHKGAGDHAGATAGLRTRGDAASVEVARLMDEDRAPAT